MPTYRVVFCDKSGEILQRDYPTLRPLLADYEQVGVEEDSYTLRLHGEPVLKGLIGPLSDGKNVVRYETPEAYELLTLRWAKARRNGRPTH